MVRKHVSLLFICIFPIVLGCNATVSPQQMKLADGLYGVLQIEENEAALPEPVSNQHGSQHVIEFRPRFVEGGADEPAQWFLLEVDTRVPLVLTEPPIEKEDSLELTLSYQATVGLKQLSRKFVGKTMAIVIGGEVATAHMVREPIEMSKLQISC